MAELPSVQGPSADAADSPAVAPWYFDWIRHWTRDDFWRQFSIRDRYPAVKVPVLDCRRLV